MLGLFNCVTGCELQKCGQGDLLCFSFTCVGGPWRPYEVQCYPAEIFPQIFVLRWRKGRTLAARRFCWDPSGSCCV